MNLEIQGNANTANIQTQKQLGKQIDPAFVKLLEYLLKSKTDTSTSEQADTIQIGHVEWNLKRGILMYLHSKDGEWVLDVFLQLLSGALYHIRKAKKVCSFKLCSNLCRVVVGVKPPWIDMVLWRSLLEEHPSLQFLHQIQLQQHLHLHTNG